MNKKLIAMTTSLVIGGTVLFGTAYANASQVSGYEAFKSSIKDTKNLKNETANLTVSLYDNGTDLVDMTSNVKVNLDKNAMSTTTTIKSANENNTFNTYKQDGKNIQKSSNNAEYTVIENTHKNFNKKNKSENPQIQNSIETVIDTLVGNMKDKVSVTNNDDGTKKVSLNLNQDEVTPLVNALTSMAVIKNTNEPMHNEKVGAVNLQNIIPQLESDIKVTSVQVNGDINKDNTIKDQIGKIIITGKDAQQKTHEITINFNLNLSNINSTTPDTVDLTGKQVKNITSNFRERSK